jgi:ABC-type nickel/cobalt efflux system permease component RcnA
LLLYAWSSITFLRGFMKKLHRALTIVSTLLLCFMYVPVVFAHPLGNFTINQYAGLHINRERVLIDYVLDMAEIPAFQEIALFDANGNGQPDSTETAAYHPEKCNALQSGLRLSLNQNEMPLRLMSSSVEFPAGVGGLPTLRLTCEFQAAIGSTAGALGLSFQNNAFSDRLGWQEIVVIADGVTLQGEFSSTSPSDRLTNYPQDLLTSPLEQRGVEFEISSVGLPAQIQSSLPLEQGNLSRREDAFTSLILLEEITLPTLLLALAVALVWGAMHALTPGHGKTIVGAYLVGSRGTWKHALYLGLTTTITHTLGVFALGLITLFAAQYIVPETLYPWMSLVSGLFVVGIGLNLFISRWKSSGIKLAILNRTEQPLEPVLEHSHAPGSGGPHKYVLTPSQAAFRTHMHSHIHHGHDHTHHDHDHSHADHSHLPPERITWRSLLALGISGGLVPCPSALVVLLGAIALNKIGFGLILVLAFSLGLAGALTATGLLFIYAGKLFSRVPSQGRIIRLVPALSALFVTVIGATIIWKALADAGVL